MPQADNSPAENVRQSSSWDIKNVSKNYFFLVCSQAVIVLFSFASIWLINRYLGTETYGSIVAIVSASQLAQLLVSWTNTALIKFGVEEFNRAGSIAKSFQIRSFILIPNVLLVLAASALWYPPVASWLKLETTAFPFVVGHILINALWLHIQHALQSIKLLRFQSALLAVERISIFAVVLSCALSDTLSWTVVILCYLFAPLLMSFVGLYHLRTYISFKVDIDWQQVAQMLRFSLPLFPTVLIGFFSSNYIDAIFIVQFASVEQLGVYSVVSQLTTNVVQLMILVNTVLTPMFVSARISEQEDIKNNYFQNILPSLMLFIGIFCAGGATLGTYLLPLILGSVFNAVGGLLWILLAACVCAAPPLLGYNSVSNAISATRDSLVSSVIANATNLLFNFLLIPRLGLTGCALATAFTYVVFSMILVFFTDRRINLRKTWNFQAALPAISGAAIYLWRADSLIAFAGCIFMTILVAVLHWSSVKVGLRQIRSRIFT